MSPGGGVTFSCKSCDETYSQHLDLQIHIAKVHQKPKSFRDLGINDNKNVHEGAKKFSCQSNLKNLLISHLTSVVHTMWY